MQMEVNMVTKLDLRRNKTMTDELTKTFFDTFGIKEKELEYPDNFTYYPEITDRILLELICLLNNYGKNDTWAISVENLKDCILMNCIKVIKEKDLKEMSLNNFKQQVRTLFEE